jgi:hypothetical protein
VTESQTAEQERKRDEGGEVTHYYLSDGWTPTMLCGRSPFPTAGEIGPLTTDDRALVTCPECLTKLSR